MRLVVPAVARDYAECLGLRRVFLERTWRGWVNTCLAVLEIPFVLRSFPPDSNVTPFVVME